jgi:hypothetical protein
MKKVILLLIGVLLVGAGFGQQKVIVTGTGQNASQIVKDSIAALLTSSRIAGNTIFPAKVSGRKAGIWGAEAGTLGDGSWDLQITSRTNNSQRASSPASTILGGQYNEISSVRGYNIAGGLNCRIQSFKARGLNPAWCFAAGNNILIYNYASGGGGTSHLLDGKINWGFGNAHIGSGYDSFEAGYLNCTGRLRFPVASSGISNAGTVGGRALGNRYYVTVAASEGDIISMFPYKGVPVDSITPRFGATGLVDTIGNVYYTPSFIPYANDTDWASHPYALTEGNTEGNTIKHLKIVNAVRTGLGATTIWFENTVDPYAEYGGSIHATQVFGTANAEGKDFRRWKDAHSGMTALGKYTLSYGEGAFTGGYGSQTRAHRAVTLGDQSISDGESDVTLGKEAWGKRNSTLTYSSGKLTNLGDAQIETFTINKHCPNIDVYTLVFFTKVDTGVYTVEIILTAKETSKDSSYMSYKFEGLINAQGSNCEVYGTGGAGTINRSIIARRARLTGSFGGDGLPTVGEPYTHGVGFYYHSPDVARTLNLYFTNYYGVWNICGKVVLTKIQ